MIKVAAGFSRQSRSKWKTNAKDALSQNNYRFVVFNQDFAQKRDGLSESIISVEGTSGLRCHLALVDHSLQGYF